LRKEGIQVGTEKYLAQAEAWPVEPRGPSSMMISDLMPQLSSIADTLTPLTVPLDDQTLPIEKLRNASTNQAI